MLPLGLVLYAAAETGSTATAGALVAAFAAASALAPARGRVVDRRGPPALVAFSLGCAAAVLALVGAAALDAPRPVLVLLAGLAGLSAPPLGPFTRSVWGLVLREREQRLQRAYALDSAGEEAALIVSPLAVALVIALASTRAALVVAALGLLAATIAAARSRLAADLAPAAAAPRGRVRLPGPLWLVFASLVPTAAALGAIDVAVPAAAREHGSATTAGVLLAAMAIGTVTGSLLAGRRQWRWAASHRMIVLQVLMALGVALSAVAASELWLLGAALVVPGAVLGALFMSLYMLVDRLAPEGSGTRTFAWLVTANNGGLAIGAAIAGAVSERAGPEFGLWFGAACALGGLIPAIGAAVLSAREPGRAPITRAR
jgi:MFS family permease